MRVVAVKPTSALIWGPSELNPHPTNTSNAITTGTNNNGPTTTITRSTALNMHTLCTMNGNREAEMGVLIFWGYLASLLSVPVCLTLFLHVCQVYF